MAREFPWRGTRDPFHILCAEFMLRRTRAEQVVPVYQELLRRYPSPADVAAAPEIEIRSLLAPLGLNWRIGQFRELCLAVAARPDGGVPSDYRELLGLPGVGPYVASAVRVFAFDLLDPLLDTNVLRFVSRYFGIVLSDSARRSPRILSDIARLVPADDPRSFWWAVLDLASSVCTPRNARHELCPLRSTCAQVAGVGLGAEGSPPS